MDVYLVERYWPGVTIEGLRDAVTRLVAAGTIRARHLESTLVPGEEYVISLFEATSSAEVAALNVEAGVPFDRVVAAMLVQP